jgi:hypothetical protein
MPIWPAAHRLFHRLAVWHLQRRLQRRLRRIHTMPMGKWHRRHARQIDAIAYRIHAHRMALAALQAPAQDESHG